MSLNFVILIAYAFDFAATEDQDAKLEESLGSV